jgi:predicted metal-dependent enzyme (double-stranded beta helix superfamily)
MMEAGHWLGELTEAGHWLGGMTEAGHWLGELTEAGHWLGEMTEAVHWLVEMTEAGRLMSSISLRPWTIITLHSHIQRGRMMARTGWRGHIHILEWL